MIYMIGLLNCDNAGHMYVLHYIYLPRINHVVASFISCWNNHPLRTANNWSPVQIWTNGMIDKRNNNIRHIAEIQDESSQHATDDLEWHGMDWSAPSPMGDGLNTVDVFDVDSPLSHEQYRELRNLDPLSLSSCFGIDIFTAALETINNTQTV